MATVYLALGSNMGGRRSNLRQALRLLETRGVSVQRVSALYQTAPLLAPGQPAQESYLNAVVEATTDLDPGQLLRAAKAVEGQAGRRPAPRWAPRVLDVDILLYENRRLQLPDLEIPHPRLRERRFVLAPLAELAPDLVDPVSHRTVAELREGPAVAEQAVERVEGPEWATGVVEPRWEPAMSNEQLAISRTGDERPETQRPETQRPETSSGRRRRRRGGRGRRSGRGVPLSPSEG